jgi:hypothetical protein
MTTPKINLYICNHCGYIRKERSTKKWIDSYCDKTGRDVHLMRVEKKIGPGNGGKGRR